MNEPNAIPAGRPRGLVAVVLLAIFLACVGWAGVIVRQRTVEPRRAAEELLASIARDGLDRAMPAGKGAIEWSVLKDSQEGLVGYEARRHTRGPGGHRVARLFCTIKPTRMHLEVWTVANNLTTSEYRAAGGFVPTELSQFPGSPAGPSRSDAPDLTFIDQAAGQVTVQRRVAGHRPEIVQASVPGNLIPEGAMDAAILAVARQGRPVAFLSITNSDAVAMGKLQFTAVRMRRVSKDCVEVVQDFPGSAALKRLCYLDADGSVVRSEVPGGQRVTERVARRVIQQILKASAVQRIENTLVAVTSEPLPGKVRPGTRPGTSPAAFPAPAPLLPLLPLPDAEDADE